MTLENQGTKAVSVTKPTSQEIFEGNKTDLPTKVVLPDEFEQLIQNLDREINCFDRVTDSQGSLSEPGRVLDKSNTSQIGPPLGLSFEDSITQPLKPTPLNDLSNMDHNLVLSKAHSNGKWLRIQRPVHLKENQNLDASLGKHSYFIKLDSPKPPKHRAHVDVVYDENCPPTTEADFQPMSWLYWNVRRLRNLGTVRELEVVTRA